MVIVTKSQRYNSERGIYQRPRYDNNPLSDNGAAIFTRLTNVRTALYNIKPCLPSSVVVATHSPEIAEALGTDFFSSCRLTLHVIGFELFGRVSLSRRPRLLAVLLDFHLPGYSAPRRYACEVVETTSDSRCLRSEVAIWWQTTTSQPPAPWPWLPQISLFYGRTPLICGRNTRNTCVTLINGPLVLHSEARQPPAPWPWLPQISLFYGRTPLICGRNTRNTCVTLINGPLVLHCEARQPPAPWPWLPQL
ncbi:hypothetical protein J6590_011279 [Homalodisca vitripennis]|nr:hypothetical protein J6590_011279 [Homalodisca vitripennis]